MSIKITGSIIIPENSTVKFRNIPDLKWTSWADQTSNTTGTLNTAVYGNGVFLALGNGISVRSTNDGITWGGITGIGVSALSSAYGNGVFMAGGLGGVIATSATGGPFSWTDRSIPSNTNQITSMIYDGNGKFIVGIDGSPNIAITEDNGATWSVQSVMQTDDAKRVGYGNGLYVVFGNTGEIAISSTAEVGSWSYYNIGDIIQDSNTIGAFAYGNGVYVIGGSDLSSNAKLLYSTNGSTWNTVTSNPFGTGDISSVVYDGQYFVAATVDRQIAISTNGQIWTKVSNSAFGVANMLNEIAFGNNVMIAVGNSGTIARSIG